MKHLTFLPVALRQPAAALAHLLATATLTLGPVGAVQADSGRSLNDARNSVHQGTSPGVVLIPAPKPAAPSPAASRPSATAPASTAAAPGTAPRPQAATAPAKPVTQGGADVGAAVSGFFAGLREAQPPSGDALRSAKRLTSDDLGVPLPTAASRAASAAASAPSR